VSDPAPRCTAALADRYAIEHELGAGGMATVLGGFADELGCRAAVSPQPRHERPKGEVGDNHLVEVSPTDCIWKHAQGTIKEQFR
jgi:hypothetical protein